MSKKFFILGVVLSILVRGFFVFNGSEVADIHSLHEMGQLAIDGVNPYLALNYNTYPPLALYMETFAIKISEVFHSSFYITTKFLPNLADFLIGVLLFVFLNKKRVRKESIYFWVLVFLLNPISILTSAAHGQLDSIPSLFVVLSIFLLTFNSSTLRVLLSAFSLGIGLAIKPNPLMLVPFFLIFKKTSFKIRLLFLLFTLLPISFLLFPFLQDNFQYVARKLLNYSGSTDFGIPALIRGWNFWHNNGFAITFQDRTLQINKEIFLSGIILLFIAFSKNKKIVSACLISYLFFITFYLGISAQYLSWLLPFAILKQDKKIIFYSLTGTVALVGFYLFFNPIIIISQFANIKPYQDNMMVLYVFGNLLFLVTCIYWLYKLLPEFIKPLKEEV